MRSILLIGLLIAALIVIYLTMTKTKERAVMVPDVIEGTETKTPVKDLPTHYEKKLKESMKKAEERTQKILDEIENSD